MPALITHHLFGERSATLLPDGVISDEEQLLAFLLGNQGPDPFFFRVAGWPDHVRASQQLANRMHEERMTGAFLALREGVRHLPAHDAGIGRAFALGILSHYQLDRTAHPFVYAQEYALIDANPELSDASSEVHAVIESDLDSWMLWRLRRATVHDCPPASELARTERIDEGGLIASRLCCLLAEVVERKFLLARKLCCQLVACHAQQLVERLLEVRQRDVRLVDAAREADDGDARFGRLRRDAVEEDGHEGSQQQGGQTLP